LTRDEKRAIPFILPCLIVTAVLIVYPLYYIISMSFSKNAMSRSGFAGLDNYLKLFHNPQFETAMINTVVWTGFTVALSFIIGFLLAVIIQRDSTRFKGFWRSLIFIAWVIPGVVKATAWKWLYSYSGGMLNHILQSIGLIKNPVPWLISSNFAMLSIVVVQVWACAPYVMLMMTAGLQQIPKDVYESADLDGANAIQKAMKVTLPMLKDISFICVLLLLVWSINEFSLIWITTNGGPAGSTTTLSLLVYNQFKVLNLNAASASAIMQLLLCSLFAIVYVAIIARKD